MFHSYLAHITFKWCLYVLEALLPQKAQLYSHYHACKCKWNMYQLSTKKYNLTFSTNNFQICVNEPEYALGI